MENCTVKSFPQRTTFLCLMNISRNVEQLKRKLKEKTRSFIESSDLNVIKESCTHEDSKIRGIACKTVIDLVKSNLFPLPQALSWFTAILQCNLGNNFDSIIGAISDLLLLGDCKHFDGWPAQHPFVLALKQNENYWSIIEFQIEYMLKQEISATGNFQRTFTLLIPVFQYTLWYRDTVSALCQRAAWRCLMKYFRDENFDFLVETLSWFSTDGRYSTLNVYYFLSHYEIELHEIAKRNNTSDTICVYYAYTSCKLAEYGYDPTAVLQITLKLLKKYPTSVNVVLVLFAQTLTRCPVEFLNTFLSSCIELIEHNKYTCVAIEWLIISAILPWMLHSFHLPEDVNKTAEILFDVVLKREKNNCDRSENSFSSLISDEYFIRIVMSEKDLYWAFVVACSLKKSSNAEFLCRMKQLQIQTEQVGECCLLHLCVSAILLSENDFNLQSEALHILINQNAEYYLPHILYLLSKATNPRLQLKLLHSVPLTAVVKENVSLVLRSIDSLFSSGKQILMNLSIQLYLALWKTEERCYSYLHDRLLEYETSSVEDVWQKDVIVASVIRDICAFKPQEHGQEWIYTLNEIIKRWHKNKRGSLPTALALNAITSLCRAEVLEVFSIYKLLSERLFDDNRVEVLKKFHGLIELMFEIAKKEDFLMENFGSILLGAVSKMWLVISCSEQHEVIFSAIKALSKCDKNEITLEVVPDVYKKQLNLSSKKVKKSENDFEESYVPGNVWIHILQSAHPEVKPKICNMLMYWFKEEVDNFPRSLYGSIRGERKDLKILHDKSLFKALVNYVKSFSQRSDSFNEDDLETSVMCLKILNVKLPKTLPLLNWTFLLPLLDIQRPSLNEQIITLFAQQSCTSSSARVSVEDYLKNFGNITDQIDDLKVVFNVMGHLCRGVSATVLRNFFHMVVARFTERWNDQAESVLPFIFDRFAEVLESTDIDENNRICVSECIKTFWEKISYTNQAFSNLLNAAIKLPSTYVEYLCYYDENQPSLDLVCKIIRLQSTLAMKSNLENPFIWLQKSIETAVLFPQKREFYFECWLPIVQKYRSHSSCWSWLLLYISYIRCCIDKLPKPHEDFLYDTLIFIVVNLSVYEPFTSNYYSVEEYFSFFPQALNSIAVTKTSDQMIDWLRFAASSKPLHRSRYQTLFSRALVSFKNDQYLLKTSISIKNFS